MTSKLLPPNTTPAERALTDTVSRVGEVPVELEPLWDADTCPMELLPWLAWAVGVDEWDSDWSEGQKRAFIQESITLKQRKGTPWAITQSLVRAGYEVTIREGFPAVRYDREEVYGGRPRATYSGQDRWWLFEVVTALPAVGVQAEELRRLLRLIDLYKNARSHLATVQFAWSDEALVGVEEDLVTSKYHFSDAVPLMSRYDGRNVHAGPLTYNSTRDELIIG